MASNTTCARPLKNHFTGSSPGMGITPVIDEGANLLKKADQQPNYTGRANAAAGKTLGPDNYKGRREEELRDKHLVNARIHFGVRSPL
jgi:hypothetical protein